jgi:hypothetical protein
MTSAVCNASIDSERTKSWQGILDIVESFQQLGITSTTEPLTIASEIRPNLPTAEQCIETLFERIRQPIRPSSAETLQARINQLRQHTLLSHTETISRMVSIKHLTDQDDADVQRKHSRSVEVWFNQAIEELFAAVAKSVSFSFIFQLPEFS